MRNINLFMVHAQINSYDFMLKCGYEVFCNAQSCIACAISVSLSMLHGTIKVRYLQMKRAFDNHKPHPRGFETPSLHSGTIPSPKTPLSLIVGALFLGFF